MYFAALNVFTACIRTIPNVFCSIKCIYGMYTNNTKCILQHYMYLGHVYEQYHMYFKACNDNIKHAISMHEQYQNNLEHTHV